MVFGRRGRVTPDAEILLVAGVTPVRIGNGMHAMSAELEHAGMVLGGCDPVALVAIVLVMTPGTYKRLNL